MKWINGRQGGNYQRLTLISNHLLKFDMHILRMKPNSYIKPHIDIIPIHLRNQGYNTHTRINIVLRKAKAGGGLFTSRTYHNGTSKRVIKFRPDIETHSVSTTQSTRYVLSIGWLSKSRSNI